MEAEGPDGAPAPVTVGTDGSPEADEAVAWAADEAARWRRPLRIVFALDTWPFNDEYASPELKAEAAGLGQEELRLARRVAQARQPDVPVTSAVLHGAPLHVLQLEAERASTLVVGHKGAGGFGGMLVGSTAAFLAGRTAGPLVVVRGVHDGAAGTGHDEVLAGTDLSDASLDALRYAAEAAAQRGARLRVVHAYRVPPALVRIVSPLDLAGVEERARAALKAACAPVRTRHPDLAVTETVVRDHPVSALSAASATADLVVLGSRGRGTITAALLGSVGHGVLRHGGCPVAIIGARP